VGCENSANARRFPFPRRALAFA